jgi:hypothetical protein
VNDHGLHNSITNVSEQVSTEIEEHTDMKHSGDMDDGEIQLAQVLPLDIEEKNKKIHDTNSQYINFSELLSQVINPL